MPCEEMLSWAKMRVSLTSMMNLRKPGKVSAPAEPASTTVVTPRAIQVGSGSTPKWLTPQYTWTCRSMRPGGHHVAHDINRLARLVRRQVGPNRSDLAVGKSHVHHRVQLLGWID